MKPKGLPKTGGRMKGSLNLTTNQMKQKVQIFIESNFDQIQADFQLLEPRERVTLYERMLKYIIPQKVENEIIKDDDDYQQPINIIIGGCNMKLND